jgi:hypothetical protein
MPQNTSHAVMAQRVEEADSLDDFPTPPWATRAFLSHYFADENLSESSAWEPACGRGHMAQVLNEYFATVRGTDVFDYAYGEVQDFLTGLAALRSVDWVITNPPFRLAEEFLQRGRQVARKGVALLTRTVFLESIGRYERVFKNAPPSKVLQYTERVPMVKGRLDQKASTATGYAWLVWDFAAEGKGTALDWIPPSRRRFEKEIDYKAAFLSPDILTSSKFVPDNSRQKDLFVLP